MSTPLPLQTSPLTGLGDHSYKQLLEDDYSFGKFTLKSKVASISGGVANYKGSHSLKDGKAAQEVKVQFPYDNYYVWLGQRADGTKVHVDLGETDHLYKHNHFVNFKFDKNPQLRLGSWYKRQNSTSVSRLTLDNKDGWSYLLRTSKRRGDFIFNGVDEFNITQRRLSRYDFLIGYLTKDYDLYLRHYSLDKPNVDFSSFVPFLNNFGIGRVVANAVYRKDAHVFGAELAINGPNKYGLTFGAQTKAAQTTFKAKINVVEQVVSLAIKGKHFRNVTSTLSASCPLNGKAEQVGLFPFPVGFTVEINP